MHASEAWGAIMGPHLGALLEGPKVVYQYVLRGDQLGTQRNQRSSLWPMEFHNNVNNTITNTAA